VLLACARAADTRPVAGPGATKDEVIKAYGWPKGQSQLGPREILNYPQGSITLTNGQVERVDFSPNQPWPTPRPRPGAPSPNSASVDAKKSGEKAFDPWTVSFPDAVTQAAKQHGRILAAFLGSDWSPPSQRFLAEVATHPDFVNAFVGDFAFLKLDFPTRLAQPAELKRQNEELRARCGVTTYPALIVISARGDPVAVVDLSREAGNSYRAQVIAAVTEVRTLLKQQPADVGPQPDAPAVAPAAAPDSAGPARAPAGANREGLVSNLYASAGWALMVGLGSGVALAIALVWWVWRSRLDSGSALTERPVSFHTTVRLRDLPSPAELQALPVAALRQLAAALFEANGYTVAVRANDPDADLELRRRGHTKANVLVCCRPAGVGPVGAKPVRELFGTLVAAGVEAGWVVTSGTFAPEARAAATERGLELIDGEGLIERLRQLPSDDLGPVLARAGA
jgi:hypothetical protein